MNNAEKFQEIFGYYATEMWAKPEAEFLDWINAEYNTTIKTNERTGEWIPVSEGLPKEKQEVYVTVYFTEGDTGRAYGYIDGFGKWHLYSTVEGTLNSGYEVTAWMPLPVA